MKKENKIKMFLLISIVLGVPSLHFIAWHSKEGLTNLSFLNLLILEGIIQQGLSLINNKN